jgi:hypothetical protein
VTVIGRLVKAMVVAGIAAVVVQSIPDIARYLRIREM